MIATFAGITATTTDPIATSHRTTPLNAEATATN